MKYAGLIENDVANGEGINVTLFMQGCPHHCQGCHNPDSWDFNGGTEIDESLLLEKVLTSISKNNIQRNLSISGGEPLCQENIFFVKKMIECVRDRYPLIKIFCWSGYNFKDLISRQSLEVSYILNNIDVLISGPFILDQRDITLKLRGSRNQEIWRRDERGKLVLDIDNM